MPYFLEEEIDLSALEIDDLDIEKAMAAADFGDGYGASARIGATFLHRWRLSSAVLADATAYNDQIQSKNTFEYYRDFIDRHTGGGASDLFVITFRGKKYHASFAEPKLSAGMLTIDLFSAEGVEIKQRRSESAFYNSDGSIFDPLSVGQLDTGRWYDPQFFTVDESLADGASIDVVDWEDRTENGTLTAGGTGSTIETEEQNGLPVLRFDGVDNFRGFSGSIVPKLVFIVMKVRAATFSSDNQWLFTDNTDSMLKSSNTTTKWQNQAFGGAFQYRLNGTVYAESDQQAPMNEFGLVELYDSAGSITLGPTVGIIGNSTHFPLVDIGDVMWMESEPSAANRVNLRNYLMRKWKLSA